ncbi:MAG: RNA-binding transcriptional accessory protein [Ruminococcaceae bacterium]|nr:RNA-binding transcriptional accessory protein [Oscillospiraceae bacterium]
MDILQKLADEFSLKPEQVEKTVGLIDEGSTIPFIARYRKEVTGSLDDTVLRELFDRLTYLRNLEKRKEEVSRAITDLGLMTEEVAQSLEAAEILTEVEDIYRPFRPKRKTRASTAKEKGLLPLSEYLMAQEKDADPLAQAALYINEEKGVNSIEEALAGAMDIIAETISDNAEYRKDIRQMTTEQGILQVKQASEDDSVYSNYYDFQSEITKLQGHRVLAINRGEKEDCLKVTVEVKKELPLNYLFAKVITEFESPCRKYVVKAMLDSYDRLIAPAIEREIRSELTDTASEAAIKVFSENLKNLLMSAPLKGKTVLGLDPGYRTGCKLAVVDSTGKVLDTGVIYPTKPREDTVGAAKIVRSMVRKYKVDVIAIGNGTASGESELFIADLIPEFSGKVRYAVVSEAGASVYSASKLGADEFPDFDVTQRSAVSIARRLQDPLAELVKIDPKSIGVGQYQHDMKPARLDEALGGVVEDCVNRVGVDLNTASHSLLSYISGINATAAKNIVKYRDENGAFRSRAQLLKVPKIGAKAFEQAAGFLRVSGSDEILDNTGVHPESYAAARQLLALYGYTEDDVVHGRMSGLRAKAEKDTGELCTMLNIGEPTLADILTELEKPGRDVRDALPAPELRSGVLDIADLEPGMKLQGTVRNVTDFGAFVDIGVHQDGLVHLSRICDRYINHPSEVLAVGDRVQVMVLDVDLKKKRIALTMKDMKN